MREMGNWREYHIRRLANDREAAIAYLQLTLEEYQVDRDLPFFKRVADLCGVARWGFRTFQTHQY